MEFKKSEQPEKIITDEKKEELTNSLLDSKLSLEESKAFVDQKYLDLQEARMSGDPVAIAHAHEEEVRIAQSAQEINALQQAIKNALDNIHQE